MNAEAATAAGRPAILRSQPHGLGRACGTFGELLQGVLPEADSDFLVTLPIARGSTASFQLDPERDDVAVHPQGKSKSRALARLMLQRHGAPMGGVLRIESDLPEGKGHASSSADLVATARAVGAALGVVVMPSDIESMLATIEPSDGVMHTGIVAFYHRRVQLLAHLGHLPPITIVGVDEGGQVDTLVFNTVPKTFTPAEKREYGRLLATMSDAVRDGDLAVVGAVATRSAVLNQRLRQHDLLLPMIDVADTIGALGVVSAHSGTILGLMLADDDADYDDKLAQARASCRRIAATTWIDHSLSTATAPLTLLERVGHEGSQPCRLTP